MSHTHTHKPVTVLEFIKGDQRRPPVTTQYGSHEARGGEGAGVSFFWRIFGAAVRGPPRRHPVQPQTLELLHQVQAENVPSAVAARLRGSAPALDGGGWRLRTMAVVRAAVRTEGGGDAAFLQQPQETQRRVGGGGGGVRRGGAPPAEVTAVAGDGRRAHVLTVPTR